MTPRWFVSRHDTLVWASPRKMVQEGKAARPFSAAGFEYAAYLLNKSGKPRDTSGTKELVHLQP